MKSVVLFIIASLVVTHCVEPSSEDVDYDLLKMIKSLICPEGKKLDVDSVINKKEIMQNFQKKKLIQHLLKLYCSEESKTVSNELTKSDVNNQSDAQLISQLDSKAVPDTITDNIPTVVTPNAIEVTKTGVFTLSQPDTTTDSSVATTVATEVAKIGVNTNTSQSIIHTLLFILLLYLIQW